MYVLNNSGEIGMKNGVQIYMHASITHLTIGLPQMLTKNVYLLNTEFISNMICREILSQHVLSVLFRVKNREWKLHGQMAKKVFDHLGLLCI